MLAESSFSSKVHPNRKPHLIRDFSPKWGMTFLTNNAFSSYFEGHLFGPTLRVLCLRLSQLCYFYKNHLFILHKILYAQGD